jgi:hypothetical protein
MSETPLAADRSFESMATTIDKRILVSQ